MVDFSLFLRLLIFDVLIAIAIAKLEINIEGKYGWAENLPTWRVKNFLTKAIWGKKPITGYHLWFLVTMLLCLHFPFFIFPESWNLNLELFICGMFLIAVILEDIFWFALNPYFGLKRFNKTDAHWHDRWVGLIPLFYIRLFGSTLIFIGLSFYL